MKPQELAALRQFLRALGIDAEREARILAACRDGGRDELITTKAAAALLECHAKSVFRYRRRGQLHPIRRSPRCIRWRKSEVEALAHGEPKV